MKQPVFCMFALAALNLSACSDESAAQSSAGTGKATFTTWGEEYIEQELPAHPPAEEGIEDGWTVKYSKFLVVIGDITVGSKDGTEAAKMSGSMLMDMHVAGEKEIVSFSDLPAKNWDAVSYVIGPAQASTTLGQGVAQADLDTMKAEGLSMFVVGTATKEAVSKTFSWKFKEATKYSECKSDLNGKEQYGVAIKNGGNDVVQLTLHGDHFFYDDLEAATALRRFDAIACADKDKNGDVTLEELAQTSLLADAQAEDPVCKDRPAYKSGSQPVNDLGAFVRALSRTVGHFRGEGECISAKID